MAKSRKRETPAQEQVPSSASAPLGGEHRERIQARAYELYLARGGSHGADWDDWLAAERELRGASGGTAEEPGERGNE